MIIKANQRGYARELARHLMNVEDNEHVKIHAINGLVSDNLTDALAEMEAVARGTRCTQPLFSVSLSPPREAHVPVVDFEAAIARIAAKNGLGDQPHVIVFHEKEGRRHAHAVFSRIDVEEMKAINLPFYKNKCMDISMDLFLEHGWKLPQGFVERELRNPLNFSLEQWQQAKRLGDESFAMIADSGSFGRAERFVMADTNGDLRDDLITLNVRDSIVNGDPLQIGVFTALSTGGYSAPANVTDIEGIERGYFSTEEDRDLAAGDFNGDGNIDIAISYAPENVRILSGDGMGGFVDSGDVTVGSNPVHVTVADFNGDGFLDLATINQDSHTLHIALGNEPLATLPKRRG